jgi:hypothetical protein
MPVTKKQGLPRRERLRPPAAVKQESLGLAAVSRWCGYCPMLQLPGGRGCWFLSFFAGIVMTK